MVGAHGMHVLLLVSLLGAVAHFCVVCMFQVFCDGCAGVHFGANSEQLAPRDRPACSGIHILLLGQFIADTVGRAMLRVPNRGLRALEAAPTGITQQEMRECPVRLSRAHTDSGCCMRCPGELATTEQEILCCTMCAIIQSHAFGPYPPAAPPPRPAHPGLAVAVT